MNPVLQQVLTVVGVLLGAAASFTAATLAERTRWKRIHSTRWDDKRLDAYSEYANAVKTAVHISYRLLASRGFPAGGLPIDEEVGRQALGEAEHERTVKWEPVLLLGSPAVVEAGRAWHERLWELEWIARGQTTDVDRFASINKEFGLAREHFYECVRADLGVVSGALPSPGLRPGRQWRALPGEEPASPQINAESSSEFRP
jgi:hypothetical protein